MLKTLFLSPPSFDGFDGGAGSRYQAKREITSYWFPTWLAQPAALVPGSRLIDAPPHHQTDADILKIAKDYELVIMHTSTPSLVNDVACARRLKEQNPDLKVGFIGAHVAVLPEQTLRENKIIDFVCRHEFDYTCKELAEGREWSTITGLSYRDKNNIIQRTEDRELVPDWDAMPSVLPTYAANLDITEYFIGYLLHPYVSWYTGRGCPAKCTFCLWPQTIGGHQYRTKSPECVGRELDEAKAIWGDKVREYMFDDDTFTINKPRAIEISKHMKRNNFTWSCNARAHVDYDTLKELRDNGLRLLLVGFESGNQEILNRIKKGIKLDMAREFMANCKKLGIKVHGTFIIGLPVETKETVEETIRFAQELDPHTIQVSIAAPYPGTELYDQALANNWFARDGMISGSGIQTSTLQYPDMSTAEIEDAVERMYKRFYFRPKVYARMIAEMLTERLQTTLFKADNKAGYDTPFGDVRTTDPNFKAIAALARHHIVAGTMEDNQLVLHPKEAPSRYDLAQAMDNLLKELKPVGLEAMLSKDYPMPHDMPMSAPAYNAVQKMLKLHVLRPFTDTYFRGKRPTTDEEVAYALARVKELAGSKSVPKKSAENPANGKPTK